MGKGIYEEAEACITLTTYIRVSIAKRLYFTVQIDNEYSLNVFHSWRVELLKIFPKWMIIMVNDLERCIL